ncbi:MAG: hypothetical protein IJW37_10325 [Lachnospiraceae bacterium]|nr:hypothetical protein [Lachnospiraceae bacterium]
MKKSGKKKGKVAGGVGAVAVLAIAALFAGKGLGFGFGDGSGTGTGDGENVSVNADVTETPDEEKNVTEVPKEDADTVTVTIEVKQAQYLIDGAEKTLADIEALLTAEDAANTSFILVDNYAAAKEWDEIKALFTEYEIDAVEQ